MLTTKEKILLKQRFIPTERTSALNENVNVNELLTEKAYMNAYLLVNFGIELTNPEKIGEDVIEMLNDYMHLNVPSSFYANPQDLRYFTSEELLIEQLVSYLKVELTGNGAIDNENPEKYDRVEVFKKTLPQYTDGKEIKLRKFTVITDEKEERQIFERIIENYASYKRPFASDELNEFVWMYSVYFGGQLSVKIECKDNIFNLIANFDNTENIKEFARQLDAKDVVKYSKQYYGEMKQISDAVLNNTRLSIMMRECKLSNDLSKKQAKGYNALAKKFNLNRKVSSDESTEKLAKAALRDGNILKALDIYKQKGSMLERNLIMLLSRANGEDFMKVLEAIPAKNPTVLMQLYNKINIEKQDEGQRVFTFYKNNKIKTHVETDYEATWRKTKLSYDKKMFIKGFLLGKIETYYKSLDKIGKVYLDDRFKNVAIPTNTSANGTGMDVLPTGSKLDIPYDNIRLFCHWTNAFDIDTSCLVVDENDKIHEYSWRTYGMMGFGEALLCSGDCRSANGAEYTDIKISALKAKGYRYVIYCINAFGANSLNEGEIYTGYQNKQDLNTKVWEPKNIETQIQVKGSSRDYIGFAIDLVNNKFIVLNLTTDSNSRIVSPKSFQTIKQYFDTMRTSMYTVIRARASELTEKPEDAEVVFTFDEYEAKENQKVVKPFDIAELVKLSN